MTVFAITGTLSKPRDVVVRAIQNAGHTVATSLTKAVDYLVQGTSNRASDSAKLTEASERGVPVITEARLYELLDDVGAATPVTKKESGEQRQIRYDTTSTRPKSTRISHKSASKRGTARSNLKQQRHAPSVAAATTHYHRPASMHALHNGVSLRSPNEQARVGVVKTGTSRTPSYQSAAPLSRSLKKAVARHVTVGSTRSTPIVGSSRAIRAAQSALSALATLLSEGWYHRDAEAIRQKLSSAKRLIESSLREVGASPAPTIYKISPKTSAILSLLQLASIASSNARKMWKEDVDNRRAEKRPSQSARVEMTRLTTAVNNTRRAHTLVVEADGLFNLARN